MSSRVPLGAAMALAVARGLDPAGPNQKIATTARRTDSQAIMSAGRYANLIGDKADIEPFAVSYADFTELSYAGGQQKGYLIPLVDHVGQPPIQRCRMLRCSENSTDPACPPE